MTYLKGVYWDLDGTIANTELEAHLTAFKGYLKSGDKFLIECCKQHISSNYGYNSKVMKTFKIAVSGK